MFIKRLKTRTLYITLLHTAICVLLLLCSGLIHAQSHWDNIDLYTTKSGIPNNSILSLHQDKKGFLWIGTYNGLCRYDGREFKTFTDSFFNPEKNWIASVNCIAEDNTGCIWIGTRGGLIAKFDVHNNKWSNHKKTPNSITALHCDSQNTIWVGQAKGQFYKMIGDSLLLLHKFATPVTQIVHTKANQLALICRGLYFYNTIQNKVTLPDSLPTTNFIEDVAIHPKYFYFFMVNKTIKTYSLTQSKLCQTSPIPHNIFKSRWGYTPTGNLLFEAENKIIEINCEGKIVETTDLNPVTSALKEQYINIILEDYSGLIWIGTNNGLFKINKNNIQFKNKTTTNSLQKIKHNYIRSVHSHNNTLWLGTKEGEIGELEFEAKTGTLIKQNWHAALRQNATIDYDFTANAIDVDDEGTLWVGCTEGFFYMPKGKQKLQLIFAKHEGTRFPNLIWAIKAIGDNIFIGTVKEGLLVFNRKEKKYSQVLLNGQPFKQPVWCISQLQNKDLWAGTTIGVYAITYDSTQNTYNLSPPKIMGNARLAGIEIWKIIEDQNDIWFGSTENGVTQLNKITKSTTHYTIENGLTENVISGLVADGKGYIWISTISGLNKLEIATKNITTYTEEDGLLSNDFNFGAATITPWGEIFLGSKVGLTSFYPDKITENKNSSIRLEITDIKIQGKEFPFNTNVPIELKHYQNYLSFRFAILEYSKPTKHTYRYQLKGFEDKWQETMYDNPLAVYTNLPPGNYTFIVQGSADGKTWNGKAQININIQPAIWQQPLFWAAVILITISLIFLLVRKRIKTIVLKERERADIVKAMAELEMKALRAQMNPHFIFNTITAIQHYIVKEDTLQANEYLAKFAKLMRLFLESSRNNYVLLSDEIQLLQLYLILEKLRFEDKFDYWLTIDPALNTNEIKIPSMLLQPFIENAINHGLMHRTEKGWLKIQIQSDAKGEKLICTINDNGVGRKKANELRQKNNPTHKSQGVKLIDERIEALFGLDDIQIEIDIDDKIDDQNTSLGTLVKLVIPLKNSNN